MTTNACLKLLDNEWTILIFKDGIGQYSALAVKKGESVDRAMLAWVNHDSSADPMDGPHRTVGCGWTVEAALEAVTEKVLFGRLPEHFSISCDEHDSLMMLIKDYGIAWKECGFARGREDYSTAGYLAADAGQKLKEI